jgi:gamma-glutamyl:cysteine ligase YbdK (ATP-grasp superfamily)
MDQGCTVGVEEDFLLVDNDGYPLARCNEVLAVLQSTGRNVESADFGARFKPDMQPVQIDAVSRKHTTMEASRDRPARH